MGFFDVIGQHIADSWNMVIGRGAGPLHMRLIIQPVVATLLGIRAGRRDARAGRAPYGWAVLKADDMHDRRTLLRDGWGDVGKVYTIAIVLDVIYGLIAFHWVYPIQTLLVATVLALVPYLIFRGLANRLSGKRQN